MSFFYLRSPKGQSAVEFALIAPLLFFIFFALIQVAYMSYVSLAVQRAALAIARTASLGSKDDSTAFKTQLVISLLPVANLSPKTLLTILASDYKVIPSSDNRQVTAIVRYPMPIWVPLVRTVFGKSLIPSVDYNATPEGLAIKNVFQLLGKQPPDLSFEGVHFPVFWMTYKETTFNEAYRPLTP
jgi:hypothetical protein